MLAATKTDHQEYVTSSGRPEPHFPGHPYQKLMCVQKAASECLLAPDQVPFSGQWQRLTRALVMPQAEITRGGDGLSSPSTGQLLSCCSRSEPSWTLPTTCSMRPCLISAILSLLLIHEPTPLRVQQLLVGKLGKGVSKGQNPSRLVPCFLHDTGRLTAGFPAC